VRVQFAKVAEFQRRGIVHFHALIRLDGPPTDTEHYPPPTVDLDSTTLAPQAFEPQLIEGKALAAANIGHGQHRRSRLMTTIALVAGGGQ
jgi:hypothetical protein